MVDKRFESKHVHQALGHVVEEMGEALQAAGKAQRWGLGSKNPFETNGETNAEWLLRELEDVEITIKLLRAFLKASYNDDTNLWDYELPEDEN